MMTLSPGRGDPIGDQLAGVNQEESIVPTHVLCCIGVIPATMIKPLSPTTYAVGSADWFSLIPRNNLVEYHPSEIALSLKRESVLLRTMVTDLRLFKAGKF